MNMQKDDNHVDWNRVAIFVDTGIRQDLGFSEIENNMREDGAPKHEVRRAISQISAARKWHDKELRS